MDQPIKAVRSFRNQTRSALIVAALVMVAALCLALGQYLAAALLPLLAALYAALKRRDRLAQALAYRIADSRLVEKIEVPHGPWGDLARSVNRLLQERRIDQRLRAALPAPLPQQAIRALLGDALATAGETRPVAVMLVNVAVRVPAWEYGVRRPGVAAWQALAHASQEVAQRYGALLQPCGNAIMLVFGAFEEYPPRQSLHIALEAADPLQQIWRTRSEQPPNRDDATGEPLALALASGPGLAVALPGLGYCVVGAPVEQALRLQQLAAHARRSGLLCSEDAYFVLRRDSDLRRAEAAGWQPTDLRVSIANRPPQVVYGRSERGQTP
jgi:class 3 adenylate cyclase